MFLEQKDEALFERMVEAIRFDVDYHLLSGQRKQTPIQGTISKDLYLRIEDARAKGKAVFQPDIRRRVFSALGINGTVENQLLFTEAQQEFKRRLKRFAVPSKQVSVDNSSAFSGGFFSSISMA